jgi:hypothetical protein
VAELLGQQAMLDIDSTIVGTTGECQEGIGWSYKGIWGDHPLLGSLANTGGPLRACSAIQRDMFKPIVKPITSPRLTPASEQKRDR